MPETSTPADDKTPESTDSAFSVRSGGVDISAQQVTVSGDVVGRDKIVQNIIQEAPAVGVVGLHQLPPPPRDFTGRGAELAELMAKAEGEGVTISGLHGMGGIGKTALALVLADRLKGRYPDAQFYLDLKGASQQPLSVSEALSHVIRAYHPTAKLPESEADLRGLYQSALHGQRALLLMDNARDADQVQPLLPPASCFLLVTSRQHFTLPGLHAKNLDTLPPGDARDLLLKIAPRLDSPLPISGEGPGVRAADAMAKLCGYLPLALRLAGSALVERPTLTPEDYLKRLAGAQTRLALVDASLSLSFDLLGEELRQAWCALSVFPGTFDLAAAAAVWDVNQDQAQDWLDALVRHSLVEWDALPPPMPVEGRGGALPPLMSGEGWGGALPPLISGEGWGGGRARLHDLARVFADARLSDSKRAAAQRRHAEHFETVLRTARALYEQGGENVLRGLALFDLERANIEPGQAWAEARAGTDDAAARLCSGYPDAGAYVLDLRHHPRERIKWREAALAAARRLNRKGSEGAHLGSLGIAYYSLGEYRRAIEYYEQRLTIAREIGNRRGEGQALGNLGLAYYSLSEYRRAIEYHEQRLTIAREMGDRRGEGNALGNLGIVYKDLGEYRRAIEYHEQHLAIAREIGDRLGEGNALGNLGSAYYHLKDYPRAREYYAQQHAIAKDIGNRLGEGNALWGLAICFEADKDMPQAIAHAQAALEIFAAIESPSAQTMRDLLAKWRGQE